jgi:hypothetical protein
MLRSTPELEYRVVGGIDWPEVATKPGVAPAETLLWVQNSAVARLQWSDTALLIRRLNELMRNIRESRAETRGWTSLLHSLIPLQLSGLDRITSREGLGERQKRGRLATALVLLACSEETPQWLREAARSIRDFAESRSDEGDEDDEGASLSVDRAISGLRLLSNLAGAFEGRPFVYPSPGDSLTIESITKKGRLTIIHDAHGNQLITSTLAGVSSARYASDAAGVNAMRDPMRDFYGA